jgi:hypothetical protein
LHSRQSPVLIDVETTSIITRVFQATTWKRALRAARVTVGKADTDKEPSDLWKARLLLAEHSPIRLVEFDVRVENIKQWITVHQNRCPGVVTSQ